MATDDLPTTLPELYALEDELMESISSIQRALESPSAPFQPWYLGVQGRLNQLLVRLAAVRQAIDRTPLPGPDVVAPDQPPTPFALTWDDHDPAEFPDLPALNQAVADHGLQLDDLRAQLPGPTPQEDASLRASIANLEAHLDHHRQIRPQVPAAPPAPEPGGLLAPVYSFLRDMWNGITSDIGGDILSLRSQLLGSINPLAGAVTALWDVLSPTAGSLYDRLDQALGDALPDDLADVGPAVAGVRDLVIDLAKIDIPAAISGAQEGIAGFLGEGLETFFRAAGGLIGTTLGGAATAFLEELETHFPIFGRGLFTLIRDNPALPDEVRPLFAEAAEPTSQVGALFGNAISQSAVGGVTGGFMDIALRPFTRALNRLSHNTHFDASTNVRALFRLGSDYSLPLTELAEQGFDSDHITLFQDLARPRPGLGDLRALANRLPAFAGDAQTELERQGYTPADARLLLGLRRVLPGPADIIRFAVREAFDESVVQRFGMDQDFPENAVPLAQRVGLASEDLVLNWRAHWDLPSATQGFEMLHRGVIDLDTLNLLLRTQDVMPFWRDKVVAIAYAAFTRVDIRRFFRLDILSRADVVRSYKDIGYDDAKAEIQARFVEAEDRERTFNQALPELRQQARLGILEGPDLQAQLEALAPDPASIEEAARDIALNVRGQRLGDLLSAYRQALRSRRITPDRFTAEASALGVTQEMIDHMVQVEAIRMSDQATAEEEVQARAAGRGTAVRRYRDGLTDADTFQLEMASLGYTELETARYLDIANLERDTSYRLDLVQAARTAFRKGRLTQAQLEERLADIGLASDLVEATIEQEISRLRVEDPDADQVELRATGRGTVLRRYREGWTSAPQFGDEMASLGYTDLEIQQYQLVADLEFDYDWKQDFLAVYRTQFAEGVIEAQAFVDNLTTLGMDPGRIQTHLAREVARKGPPE